MIDLTKEYRWAKYAFEKNNLDMSDYYVPISFNNRLTSTMGRAKAKRSNGIVDGGTIELSGPLWSVATEEQCRETTIHEACHIIDYIKNNKSNGHGTKWKFYMIRCGLKPERCHEVDTSQFKRKVKRHRFECGCIGGGKCVTRIANRIKNGATYTCSKCRQRIYLSGTFEVLN